MSKVLIAYNKNPDKKRWDIFKKTISSGLCAIKSETFKTTQKEIQFVSTAGRIEALDVTEYSVIIAAEEVDSLKLGVGRIKKWRAANKDLKVILIVDKEKKSSGKLNALYELGYYDALLSSDFKMKAIEKLILYSRTEEDAYDYYGLMLYTDYSKLTKTGNDKPIKELVEEYKNEQKIEKESVPAAADNDNLKSSSKKAGKVDVKTFKDDENVKKIADSATEITHKTKTTNDKEAEGKTTKEKREKKDTSGNGSTSTNKKTNKTVKETKKGAKNDASKKDAPVSLERKREDVEKIDVSANIDFKRSKSEIKDNKKGNAITDGKKESIPEGKDTQKRTKSVQKGNVKKSDVNSASDIKADKKDSKLKEKENAKKQQSQSAIADDEETKMATSFESESNDENTYETDGNKNFTEGSLSEYLDVVEEIYGIDEDEDEDDELLDEPEFESFDASPYLILATENDYYQGDTDWLNADEKDIKRYIKCMEKKAFNPVKIEPVMDRESEVLEELLDYFTSINTTWIANLESGISNEAQFSQVLWEMITSDYQDLTEEQMNYVFNSFCNYMWGYDILTPLINDPTISDIALVAYNNIQVKKHGERFFSTITFRTPNHFTNFINHIVRMNHVDLSDKRPNKTFMDTSTSAAARMRFVYSKEYINASGEPSLVIRKVPTKKYSISDLVRLGMMDYNTAGLVVDSVSKGKSILLTGTMGSGKTSLYNTCLDFMPLNMRGLIAQENEELFSNTNPLLMFQDIRPSEDGEMMYDLRYLLRFGLLMDFNIIGIGEIKGGEAEQFCEAVYTNCVCYASVHSTGAREAIPRIAELGVTKHFTKKEQERKLSQGIDMVIYLEDFVVREIVTVDGWDEENKETLYTNIDINIPKRIGGKKSRSENRQEKKAKRSKNIAKTSK